MLGSLPMTATEAVDKRVDLSNLTGDALRKALWPVVVGLERFSFTEKDIQSRLGDFEVALWDYHNCARCQAMQVEAVQVGKREQVYVRDCTASLGNGLYLGLSYRCTQFYGVPTFAAIACNGPANWRALQARRMRAHRDEKPSRAMPATEAEAADDLPADVQAWAARFGRTGGDA